MKELFNSFEKSVQRFEEILKEEKSIKNRDSAIKRFEFTIELAWKCVQKFLREEEIICRSPKECLKEAFKFGLVEDDPRWIEALEDRNLTVHTYDESTADDVYSRLPNYLGIFNLLRDKLKEKMEE
ncbi:nucleotidyltransferase substrate binding protein [Patescibacteria group bacterium]|nr:nucleotidyltransferase substrate binding protein [Patescibacteria group bacterium]MBU4000394.1 nucleotidyltransferase substrate binding protein [Patescibacteria group bacterium]MBU4056913.1 nucleotidyltransferase substrate binding protein [Patescibacteria group bacterium]MBU4369053.1 nucleotidyltransferase substrate binding protein [Patescibacteria group bacterium]